MNANTFRLIFSKRLGMCVPVAEQRSAQGKTASEKTVGRVLNPLAFSLTLLCAAPALALPVAPTVAHGSASFSQSGSTLTVTNTPNAIINWGSFSIGQNELTKFVQQSSASAVLNRVTGQSPSQILGQLQSNGRVFLINPNGIVFGQGARIDTTGLIASTLKLSDADFLAGKLSFSGTGSEAKVDNQGTINTAQGGFVYLIAPNVENSGLINAPNGDVLLAAGHSVEIADGLNPALRVVLTAPEGSVINLGQILAESGRIGLHGGMVANSGMVSASSAVAEGGKIYLRATEKIELTETSKLTADGTVGGEITAITQKGGQIAGELVARGEISAQGNGTVGSGGFVETSAAKVDLNGISVNTNGGNWLIDPFDFTIAASGGDITGAALGTLLGSNSVQIQTTTGTNSVTNLYGTTGTNGDIFVNDAVTWNAATTLTLSAYRNISINQSITASNATGKLALEYGQGYIGNAAPAYSVNAPVNLQAGNNFSTKLGTDATVNYTVITSLGVAGDTSTTTLQGMSNNLTGDYVLGSNIDASATSSWNSGLGFAPIGSGTVFSGIFDGLGHTISGLTINRPVSDGIGLFGYTNGATIRNIGLVGGTITGRDNVGSLVGNHRGVISHVYATANVSGRYSVGGLVGKNGSGSTINNSFAAGNVSSNFTGGSTSQLLYIGGLAGYNEGGSISQSYSAGSVSSNLSMGLRVGGLVGYDFGGSISNSYSTGSVSGYGEVGGLIGTIFQSNVTNAYSTGRVTGTTAAFGLIGYQVSGDTIGVVTNSYWDMDTSGKTVSFGGTGINSTAAYNQATYNGFDFNTTWWMSEGNTRPFLRMEWSNTITNAHQLQLMAMNLSASYTLANNIDLAPALNAVSGLYPGMWGSKGFVPVGNYLGSYAPTYAGFTGSFDGLNHTISNLAINRPTDTHIGLFGYLKGDVFTRPSIKNIELTTVDIVGFNWVGGLVGLNNFSNIDNASITGSVTGNANVGGLAGTSWTGSISSISNSDSAASVTGTQSVGGLAGANLGTINNSYSIGSVTGRTSSFYIGGLVGYNDSQATISSSYSTGSITAGNNSQSIGGLVGYNLYGGANISNSYSTGSVTAGTNSSSIGGLVGNNVGGINKSYSAGSVTAGSGSVNVGGLVGSNFDGTNTGNTSYSFWDIESSGQVRSAGGIGMTTSQMKDVANFTTATTANGNVNPGWDFTTALTSVWKIDSGTAASYPYLRNPEQIPHPGLSGGITTCDVCSWDGGGGSNYLWSLSANWTGNLLPAANSTVTIDGSPGTILFDIDSLSLFSLTLASPLNILSGKTLTLTNEGNLTANLSGEGTLNIAGAAVSNAGTINIANLNLSAGSLTGTGNLTVSRNFDWTAGSILGSTFQNLSLAKQGNFSIGGISAVGNITLDAQAWGEEAGNLTLTDDVSKTGGSAATLSLIADGKIVVGNSVTIAMEGSGNTMAFTAPSGADNGGTISPGGGTLNVTGDFTNYGAISPGGDGQIGTLNVTGDLSLTGDGTLNIDLGGTGVGQSDHIHVTGDIVMDGMLDRTLIGGYNPVLGDEIPFITANGVSSSTFEVIDDLTSLVTGYRLAPGEAARQIFSGPGYNTFTNFVGGLTWETAGNWSAGYIPDYTQTAIITSSPLSPVTHSIGTDSIAGLLISAGNALDISGGSLAVSGTSSVGGMLSLLEGTYANDGTLNIAGLFNLFGGTFTGAGAININGGMLNVPSDSTVNWVATGPMANSGTMSLANQTITNAITNSGTFNSGGGLTFTQLFTNQGTFNANSGMSTFSNGLLQSAGNLVLGGGNVTGNLTLNGGSLKGAGTMTGNVSLDAATLAPGSSPGTLNITGNLTLSPSSTTAIELWGTTAGLFDVINVSGSASLAGALNATTGNGYVPGVGHALRFMTFASSTGNFGSTSLPSGMSLSALTTALDLLGPAVPSALPTGVSSSVNLLDTLLNLGAVSFETPLLYLAGQSSPTASSSGTLTQTAEILLPDLMPQAPAAGNSGDDAPNGSAVASLIPMFDQLVRDASFKDTPHDSRLICR